MKHRHSPAEILESVGAAAFIELIAWGFTVTEAWHLLTGETNETTATRYLELGNHQDRLSGLVESNERFREWRHAFALLLLNGWSASSAYRRLKQGRWLEGQGFRKAASRATGDRAVCFALVRLHKEFDLTKRTARYVERSIAPAFQHQNFLLKLAKSSPDLDELRAKPMTERHRDKAHAICGARTRSGGICKMKPEPGKKRCRLHGGLSTGPKTAEGKARSARNGILKHVA